ncbi:MAG: peptide deformylase [Parachlamydiaceae bacterium]|nr:peptide deformylase [Parachlamydiaceae bacterium]
MTDLANSCPCCSGRPYTACCRPFHRGVIPENAQLLMRSRYTAYVLNIPEYIVATTHPASPQFSDNKFSWKRSISQFSRNSTFQKLEILDFKENKALAAVTFTAYLSQDNRDATFTERSYFEKIDNHWFYRNGHLAQGYAPKLVNTGPLKVLPFAYYGDSILTKKAESIIEITSDIQKLVEEMIETLNACDGIGLAAPQVHHSLRLFIIKTPIETEQNKIETSEIKVFINPKLSLLSNETWKASEGCLSIPTIRASIERPKEITVEYTSIDGKLIKTGFSGWEARVIMHENDHIDGVLFIDRLDTEERLKLTPLLKILEKRMSNN